MKLYTRIKERVKAFGRRVQAAVVHVSLFLLYFFGIGAAKIWAKMFHRHLLNAPSEVVAPSGATASSGTDAPSKSNVTYWLPPTGHHFDEEESLRQS